MKRVRFKLEVPEQEIETERCYDDDSITAPEIYRDYLGWLDETLKIKSGYEILPDTPTDEEMK